MGSLDAAQVQAHDLLALGPDGPAALEGASGAALPAWALQALADAPWVVVRRAQVCDGLIPVGIRGRVRRERHAAYLPSTAVVGRVRPEDLVAARAWRADPWRTRGGVLAALEPVAALCEAHGLVWGPTGSTGFTLASGHDVLTATSDLDLVLRIISPLALDDARDLYERLVAAACATRLDIQMETPAGAIALAEYIRGQPPVLLRTASGPRLVDEPAILWATSNTSADPACKAIAC
jgi:phosphoribosyl-dephospho-CoA transferase